ncbi:DUF4232 domain-containing protein [Saccharopolyspora griseoalba]|uniref:DUF4232 domain-containing protein n=1 Tax=Saccharopolyspora griseoalba TaxID=1431848 RepID=A0ABW2LPM1_9PSEU
MSGNRILVGAAAALLTVGLGACGTGGANSAGGTGAVPQAPQRMTPIDTPQAQPQPQQQQQGAPAPADEDSAEAPAPESAEQPEDDAQPSPRDTTCEVGELELSLRYQGSGAGSQHQALVFTNSGDRTCEVQGFPGVSYVAGSDGHQVGAAAFRTGSKGAAISLAPGQRASAPLELTNVDNYDAATCEPTPAKGLRVYPPHSYDSVFVPMSDAQGCAAEDIPGHQLTVKTLERGVPTGP